MEVNCYMLLSQNLVPRFAFQMHTLFNPCGRGVVDLIVDLNLVEKEKSTPYGHH